MNRLTVKHGAITNSLSQVDLRLILGAALALVLLAVSEQTSVLAQSTQSASKQSRYGGAVDPKPLEGVWDFGYVPVDFKMIYTAPLRNTGSDTLEIQELASTCECTSATSDKKLISPGESAQVTLSFDTKKFYGPQERFIEIHTSDPNHPERLLRFTAVVSGRPESVDMLPRNLFNLDSDSADTLVIKNYTSNPLSFKVVYSDTSLYRVSFLDSAAPASGYLALAIKRTATMPKGTHLSTLTLEFASNPPVRISTPLKFVKY